MKGEKGIMFLMLEMIVNYYECLDGSGYFCGIIGEKLSWLVCIMVIVDVYDVMMVDRFY